MQLVFLYLHILNNKIPYPYPQPPHPLRRLISSSSLPYPPPQHRLILLRAASSSLSLSTPLSYIHGDILAEPYASVNPRHTSSGIPQYCPLFSLCLSESSPHPLRHPPILPLLSLCLSDILTAPPPESPNTAPTLAQASPVLPQSPPR